MTYVAITQPTCSWLLSHTHILGALHSALMEENLAALSKCEFSSGALRLAGSEDGKVLAIWNRDYLTGTGTEQWGIFKLSGEHGLQKHPNISQPVFERTLYVINQRLQGLVLESDLIHRPWPNGSHTCLAGRGSEARHYSIAYSEGGIGFADLSAKAIFLIGPEHDFDTLQKAIDLELKNFAPAASVANKLIDSQRKRPLLEAPAFQGLRQASAPSHQFTPGLEIKIAKHQAAQTTAYETLHWTFEQWLQSGSLNDAQRRVLNSDVPAQHPVRILGPAGSGKTLLMQMLAMKHLCAARKQAKNIRVIYVVHNAPMAQSVGDRFRVLGAEDFLTSDKQQLFVATLSEYGRKLIGLSENSVIDKDAQKTKAFQFEQIQIALKEALDANVKSVSESPLLSQIKADQQLFDLFSALVMVEISSVIKGRGLDDDEKRYVAADAPLSRLHGILTQKERSVVFNAYSRYHDVVFEEYEMLDSDDVAISLAGRLRTPVWNLKRRSEGFDFVFVDEVQLFNENERRIFPYLTKGNSLHVPIALALDEAQEPFGFSTAGLATLGIADVESEELPSNHRSTKEIVKLAFFVIQRTTDLFGNEFPDFTNLDIGRDQTSDEITLPTLVRCNDEAPSYAKFVLRIVQKLRAKNVRQIAVICHAETYWRDLEDELSASQLPLHIITQRGEKLAPDQPLVVLSRPAFVGGQEFDSVVLVGLELGVMPPRVQNNPPLSAALEQQVLREIYLAVTRARQSVILTLNKSASPNAILDEALSAGLLVQGSI